MSLGTGLKNMASPPFGKRILSLGIYPVFYLRLPVVLYHSRVQRGECQGHAVSRPNQTLTTSTLAPVRFGDVRVPGNCQLPDCSFLTTNHSHSPFQHIFPTCVIWVTNRSHLEFEFCSSLPCKTTKADGYNINLPPTCRTALKL